MPAPFDALSVAREVEAARQECRLIEPFSARYPGLTLAQGYEAAAELSTLRRATGARPAGRKIGFTNRTIWAKYNVGHPIWGWMYDETIAAPSDQPTLSVPLDRLVQPAVEPEVVFGMGRAVPGRATPAELVDAIAWVALGWEIVHCHYPGWTFEAVDTIIDGGLHAALRVGAARAPWPEMAGELASFSVVLSENGERRLDGRGANVLDSPLHALSHLTDLLADRGGLAAGEVVTTGTITDAVMARPGQQFDLEVRGLALVPTSLLCV
jgi:2-oxo-3-hexenedioate decarboxylase